MKKQIVTLVSTFALILGCSAMPPAHKPSTEPPVTPLVVSAPAWDITGIEFYGADINATDWTKLDVVSATNGQMNVPLLTTAQPYNSTWVYTSDATGAPGVASDYSNIATNTIGDSPLTTNAAPVLTIKQ